MRSVRGGGRRPGAWVLFATLEAWFKALNEAMGVAGNPVPDSVKVAGFLAMVQTDPYYAFQWLERPQLRTAILTVWLGRNPTDAMSYWQLNKLTKVRSNWSVPDDEPVIDGGLFDRKVGLEAVKVSSFNELLNASDWESMKPLLNKCAAPEALPTTIFGLWGCGGANPADLEAVCDCSVPWTRSGKSLTKEKNAVVVISDTVNQPLCKPVQEARAIGAMMMVKVKPNSNRLGSNKTADTAELLEWAIAAQLLRTVESNAKLHIVSHVCKDNQFYFYGHPDSRLASDPVKRLNDVLTYKASCQLLVEDQDAQTALLTLMRATIRQRQVPLFNRVFDLLYAYSVMHSNFDLADDTAELADWPAIATQSSANRDALAPFKPQPVEVDSAKRSSDCLRELTQQPRQPPKTRPSRPSSLPQWVRPTDKLRKSS